jgi:hypothetical protein
MRSTLVTPVKLAFNGWNANHRVPACALPHFSGLQEFVSIKVANNIPAAGTLA